MLGQHIYWFENILKRVAMLFFATCWLLGCGGGAAQLDWEAEEPLNPLQLFVNDSGIQLAWNSASGFRARSEDGEPLGELIIPRSGFDEGYTRGDNFVLYGNEGQELWELVYDGNLQLVSDSVVRNSDIGSIRLIPAGTDRVVMWYEGDQPEKHYWIPETGTNGILPASASVYRSTIDTNYQYGYLDTSFSGPPRFIQIDLLTGEGVSEFEVPAEFVFAEKLMMNETFLVGTKPSGEHSSNDLLVYNFSSGALTERKSSGGFGGFDLRLLGQDDQGTIYYSYYATLPHSDFSFGLHVAAIDNSTPVRWEKNLSSSPLDDGDIFATSTDSGVNILFVTRNDSLTDTAFVVDRTSTTRFISLGSSGATQRSFYLTPIETRVVSPLGGNGSWVTKSGYRGTAFGVDGEGEVYIYGNYEAAEPDMSYEFSGRL